MIIFCSDFILLEVYFMLQLWTKTMSPVGPYFTTDARADRRQSAPTVNTLGLASVDLQLL